MENNSLQDFTTYIESLCTKHVEIRHQKADPRFIELNNEKQLNAQKMQLYPLVALDKLTISYGGQNDAMQKSRTVDLLFLDKAKQVGDYAEVQRIKNRMERVAEEFVIKIKIDSKDRVNYPFLRNLVIGSIELNLIDNEGINVHGALLSFSYELPFTESIEAGRFK
ncbi:MAG TPA: hypothetical protein P5084_12380 [Paludibacter sp.]|nr:hypothetical protein [Paludibacter sp.]